MTKGEKIGYTTTAIIIFILATGTLINGELQYKGVRISGIQAYVIGIMNFILSIAMFYSVFRKTSDDNSNS